MSLSTLQAAELIPVTELPKLDKFPAQLSEETAPSNEQTDTPKPAVAPKALSDAEAKKLLERLEPLPKPVATEDFALRPSSEAPPKTTSTLQQPFPPPATTATPPVVNSAGDLNVTRFAPQGDVALANQISISFDRPMVAVSTQTQTVAESVPVTITPALSGNWRWLGTQTLVFEQKNNERLPMSTEFKLSIPADTKAVDGSRLAKPVQWTFKTPTLKLQQSAPSGKSIGLNPLLFLEFNQRIDAAKLLPFIQIEAKGQNLKARLATEAEIQADSSIAASVKQAPKDQSMVLKLEKPLATNTSVTVKLAAKAPSAEGMRETPAQNLYSFSTYAPLSVTETSCGYSGRCTADETFQVAFNNTLPENQAIDHLITINPKPDNLSAMSTGDRVLVNARWQANKTYTVSLSPELKDQYGQTLTGKNTFSFKVEKSPAYLGMTDKILVTLDPNMPAVLPLYSTNYRNAKLTVQSVQPSDWPAFLKLTQALQQNPNNLKQPLKLPGKTLTQQTLKLDGAADTVTSTEIDLKPWLKDGKLGQLVVMIEPGQATVKPHPNDLPQLTQLVWVQGTHIGLDAYAYADKLLAWGGDLSSGKTVADLALSLHSSTNPAVKTQKADARGLAALDYLDKEPKPTATPSERETTIRWLEAKSGDDLAILPDTTHPWSTGTWQAREQTSQTLWYVLDDRHLYRPNEEVHIKGWVRDRDAKPDSELTLPKDLTTLRYEVQDISGNKIAEGTTKLSGLGGFSLDFKLPATPNLGTAQINFKNSKATEELFTHRFEIQEFRTPEFEVKTELTNAAPYIGNQAIHISANANYYAGGGLADAPVLWRLTAERESYSPPNQSDWSFGFVNPIWWRWDYISSDMTMASFAGKTQPDGQHALLIQPNTTDYPSPLSVNAEATITDVNRQAWTAESKFLIHPASTYVGLKTASYFVEQTKPLELDLLTVDIDGKALANNPVIVEVGLVDLSKEDGKQLKDVQRCTVQTDAKGLAHCQFKTEQAGQYRITATTMDKEGRRNATRITRWVSGDNPLAPKTADSVEMQEVRMIPDKDSYASNDTAKLLIQAPFDDAEGLLLVNHNGLVTEQRFTMQGNSHTVELPLKPAWLPNVNVTVNLVAQTTRLNEEGKATDLPKRPAIASGELSLKISKAERTLAVQVQPQKDTLAPAEATPITVKVTNAKNEPAANTEVALVVVDEAILMAGGYQLADPLDTFYPESSSYMSAQNLRSSILLPLIPNINTQGGRPGKAPQPRPGIVVPAVQAMGDYEGAVMAKGNYKGAVVIKEVVKLVVMQDAEAASATGGAGTPPSKIVARTNFNPLAAFVPNLVTDAQGQVTTTVKLPDNLTRYRIMAVAAQDATHYGKGESHLTARKELMVRPSAPRFLNFGDSFELPVVLQNQSDQPMSVQVALDATNLELTQAKGYALEIPANDRVEVRFPAKTINVGQVAYQIAAATSTLNDAATGSLPVWTPATSEAFATYGVVDQGAISQAIETPKQVLPQFGELNITTSSTALQSLSDAFIYLQKYPYSCSEQIASRMLSTAALKDVLQAFKAKDMPSPEAIEKSMQRDLESLAQRQKYDGRFSLWDGSSQDWPYANVHVAHALIRAKEKGYKVNDYMLDQSMDYLKNIEQHFSKDYSPEVRRYITAYSLYVRQLADDNDRPKALALIKQAGGANKLSTEVLGWLLNVLAGDAASAKQREELTRELLNRTQETAAGATIQSNFGAGDYWVMHSDRAANGIVLDALIKDQPKSDLIPKLVKGLQNNRTQGHWGTTQDNAFILLALDKYFQTYENQTPDFVAKAWLGKDFAGEQSFKGRSMDSVETEIPMAWLLKGEQRRDLVLDKQGEGRLYYRIGLKYAPESLDLAAMEQGFTVTRAYRGLDNPDDVKQREDGTWQVKAGARVEVTLTMLAASDRHHVALVDALPAGFEAVNPALAVSAKEPNPEQPEPIAYSWMGTWYDYQNLRDERAEAFASILPSGVYTYRYIARATTPGTFVAPPAKAEEMYHPETFGRSASAKVIVE